jgi:hypothetical protein
MPKDTEPPAKAVVVGRVTTDALEGSYARAFEKLGISAAQWNMPATIDRNARGGRIGALVGQFWPVETWTAKASRELLLFVMDLRPDLVVVGGTNRVSAGALAQIKASLPKCKLVLIWPDTLLNCYSHSIDSLPVYDLVAAFSRESIDAFVRLGARRVSWVPLAFDPDLHPPDLQVGSEGTIYADCDASFVGNYSPEREELVLHLTSRGFRIKVWGPVEWRKSAKDRKALRKYWQGGPLFGKDYCLAIKSAPISLNPISPLTFPAANMRFFEILGMGGTPLSAPCPEMQDEFPDQEACFYYGDGKDVADVLERMIRCRQVLDAVVKTGQERILRSHTYVHRTKQILNTVL